MGVFVGSNAKMIDTRYVTNTGKKKEIMSHLSLSYVSNQYI